MSGALKQFFHALTVEERQFLPILEADRIGLILRCAVGELDWREYNARRAGEPDPLEEEALYLLRLGVARLIQLTFKARDCFSAPTLMVRRTDATHIPAMEIARGLGMIEHGRRVAQSVSAGLARIELTPTGVYRFVLPSVLRDPDYHERKLAAHFRRESNRLLVQVLQMKRFAPVRSRVGELLSELVYPWREHYIGYGADPLLDDYFFGLAHHEVQSYQGYDTFHYTAQFGGVRFHKYVLGLKFLIAFFRRHVQFAEALVEKEPSVKLENILTISSDTPEFMDSMQRALNSFGAAFADYEETTLPEARQIFEVLSLSRKNASLLDRPGAPLPLLIQWSDSGFIRCLTGSYGDPMLFLLDSLRHSFPKDYAKHQQSREFALQRAVRRVLDECCGALEYRQNVKVRLHGKELTDIDLAVLEPDTGVVLVCQLKHQDLYGGDIHSRHVRSTRLQEEVRRWLDAVQLWNASVGEEGVRSALRVAKSVPPLQIFFLVISRHYAHPLRELPRQPDVQHTTWMEFVNAVMNLEKREAGRRRLSQVFETLQDFDELRAEATFLEEPPTAWVIRGLRFSVEQEPAERGATS